MEDRPFPQMFKGHAEGRPEAPALVLLSRNGNVERTYGELFEAACLAAASLRSQAAPGGRVLLTMEDPLAQIEAFLGCLLAGIVPGLVPPRKGETLVGFEGAKQLSELPAARVPSLVSINDPSPTDGAYLQFTGGSTGRAKAALISHGALSRQLWAAGSAHQIASNDVFITWAPLFHDLGLVGHLLIPLSRGARTILLSSSEWILEPAMLLRAIDKYGGTVSGMPNFGFAHCNRYVRDRHLRGLSLASLRLISSGGEPVQRPVMEAFRQRFEPYGLSPLALNSAYGLAEYVCSCTTSYPRGLLFIDDLVSCGRPIPGTEIRVVGDNGEALGEGLDGEIEVRGGCLFSRYEGEAEGGLEIRDGWLRTGDLGSLRDGELYVRGRSKDVMIVGGENHHPQPLEAIAIDVLGREGGRVVAFGMDIGGSQGVVIVGECSGKSSAQAREFVNTIRQRVLDECGLHLEDVRLVDHDWVPVATSGKLARTASREKYLNETLAKPSPKRRQEGLSLLDYLEQTLSEALAGCAPQPDQSWLEAGLDSLGLVRVLDRIENETGLEVPIAEFAASPTTRCLLDLLEDRARPVLAASASTGTEVPSKGVWAQIMARGPVLRNVGLPYFAGKAALRGLATHPLSRKALFGSRASLIQSVLGPDLATREVIALNAIAHSWTTWRRTVLDSSPNGWVEYRNWEIIDAIRSIGVGMVCAVHHTPYLRWCSQRIKEEFEIAGIGNLGDGLLRQQGLSHLFEGWSRPAGALLAAQSFLALKTVRRGGAAVLFADHWIGEGGISMPLMGRQRPYRPGLAELSLLSGAPLVPVFCFGTLAGRVIVEVSEPLVASEGTHQERVEGLMRAYAELLEKRWKVLAGTWSERMWLQHGQLPRAT